MVIMQCGAGDAGSRHGLDIRGSAASVVLRACLSAIMSEQGSCVSSELQVL